MTTRTLCAVATSVVVAVGAHVAGQQNSGAREPAVAGSFYPADARALRAALDGFFTDAVKPAGPRPIALVAPHAGYVFSGQIAADAWNQAASHEYDAIVLLGTNHTGINTRRVTVYAGSTLRTPLGDVAIDAALTAALLDGCRDCVADQSAHAREHSIEVHLPFVQRLFPQTPVVAAIVGPEDPDVPARTGRALAAILSNRRALIVASSDLSHYPSARQAVEVDRRTIQAVIAMDVDQVRTATSTPLDRGVGELATCACGEAPVLAAIVAARGLGATRGHAVSYANSGDLPLAGSDRVVGYAAIALTNGEPGTDTSGLPGRVEASDAALTTSDHAALLALARRTITRFLESGTMPLPRGFSAAASRPQGLFVTLRKRGRLRGCIGQTQPDGSIPRLVARMALAAAFQDQRFAKVSAGELKDLKVEISLMTPFAPVRGPGEIQLGRDGVVLQKDGKSAIFLPQVATEEGWGRLELLDNLCNKAGLASDCWRSGARLSTFQAEIFSEPGHAVLPNFTGK